MIILHVYIIILHVHISKSHADIIYLPCRGHYYATITYSTYLNIKNINNTYNNVHYDNNNDINNNDKNNINAI